MLLCASGTARSGSEPQTAPSADELPWIIELKGRDNANIDRHYYEALAVDSGAVASEAVHMLKSIPPVGYFLYIDWKIHTENLAGTEHSLLDRDYGTINVKTTIPGQDTDYVIRRDGTRLSFDGRYRGEALDKTVTIDHNPFFTNPTIGLRGFVLSGDKEGRFWMLRPDNLKVYEVTAVREQAETITVDGRSVDAVRIHWGLAGIRSLFFKRDYWFRVSDGLFVKSEEADGVVTVWKGE